LPQKVSYGPFDFPFLELDAMAEYAPPRSEALETACDFVVFSATHFHGYGTRMQQASPAMQARWEEFYRRMAERFPPLLFSAPGRSQEHPFRAEIPASGGLFSAELTAAPLALPEWIAIYDLGHSEGIRAANDCSATNSGLIPLDGGFTRERGHLFAAPVPHLKNSSDSMTDGTRSRVALCEDGRLLGPAHSPHQDIRRLGRGRFSHWNDLLYFSTSDNTDPNDNGRSYRIIVPE
jgi:hypothetical protein